MPHGALIPCQYSETIPAQDWTMEEDTLTVTGYLCQKATCRFRGRNFTSWFTMDIPIQNGPWKFGGLPGLILKVYDDDRLYEFECMKIENFKQKYPITVYSGCKNYEKTNRQKLHKLVKTMHDYFSSVSGWSRPRPKIPYHPLELE
jgi:GLPGLI family protein